jgi:serine protease
MNFRNHFLIFTSLLTAAAIASAQNSQQAASQDSESYIVVLKKDRVAMATAEMAFIANSGASASSAAVSSMLSRLASRNRLNRAEKVFSRVLHGGVYRMTMNEAQQLSLDSNVAYVEREQIFTINSSTQANPTWGLDRIDQSSSSLSRSYTYPDAGLPVNVYVIDTGILTTHQQFGGRASSAVDVVDNDNNATDCNGHGTHVAGTVGSQTYGVAKNAKLFAVRVLDCEGSGSTSDVIAGVEWVTAHHVKPAVANMSVGGGASQALDDAIAASIQAGVTYVVAAGNESTRACNSSPARVPLAITVGSTTTSDARSDFSNYGSCLSVFAPGSDITSTWYTSNTATNKISGTSMASPHVAGVAALYLAANPTATPAQVKAALLAGSLSGKVSGAGAGSPNLLINTQFLMSALPPQPTPVPANQLASGAVVANLAGAANSEKQFTVVVPANSKNLSIVVSGGSGDVDLYVKFGSKPSASSYDCRPYLKGNNESCTKAAPRAGVWYITMKGYSTFSGATLRVQYQPK